MRPGGGGGGDEVAGKVRALYPSSDKTNRQRLDGACTSSSCLLGGGDRSETRALREARVYLDFPSQRPHLLQPALSAAFLETRRRLAARGTPPGGRRGSGRAARAKPHYFLISWAGVEGEGFHLGATWKSL